MLMTTTNSFEGYHVDKYLGIISKDIIFRSGLGKTFSAALTNIVASFSLRDVELSGSSELIANAKDYLIHQLEQLAKSKGANAIIGIDIQTSFGEALARVAISGTAVVVNPNNPSVLPVDDVSTPSTITISRSNSPKGFLPIELELLNRYGSIEVSLLLQSLDDDVPSDILADIELTSIFGDSQTIEKVSFTGIHKEMLKYRSNPIRITLLDHIASCIESCSMKIRKYKQNNQLIEISDLEMHDDENNQKLLKEMIKSMKTDKFGWILDENPEFIHCPNCNERLSIDYMKFRVQCPTCGQPHTKIMS